MEEKIKNIRRFGKIQIIKEMILSFFLILVYSLFWILYDFCIGASIGSNIFFLTLLIYISYLSIIAYIDEKELIKRKIRNEQIKPTVIKKFCLSHRHLVRIRCINKNDKFYKIQNLNYSIWAKLTPNNKIQIFILSNNCMQIKKTKETSNFAYFDSSYVPYSQK